MLSTKKICIILGTRPEIIKLLSLIKEFEKKRYDYFILHTNQHYSEYLDKIFFNELEVPHPKYNLNVGSGLHGEQTGKMISGIEQILIKEKPDLIFIEGDTNTVLAGAIAASKLHIGIAHVEAGLRSYSKEMPEETNRIIVDHIADYLLCPTGKARETLIKEGISDSKVVVTGNTIVDAVNLVLKFAVKSKILSRLKLSKNKYYLLTLHREENTKSYSRLKKIFSAISKIHKHTNIPIIYPIHPRTKRKLLEYKMQLPEGIEVVDPVGYFNFLWLEKNSGLIFTDSGGIQEEACILHVPCVTLRENTERPETVDVGSNILAGTSSVDRIFEAFKIMRNKDRKWPNPFGEGVAYRKIINFITNNI